MTSSLVVHVPGASRSFATDQMLSRAHAMAAVGFLLGVLLALLGFSWDVQWHTDVGPDSFFTAPHLVLYGGIAISGIVCLAMVLLTTVCARRGIPVALVGTTSILGGHFQGPLGYVVGGFGALFFLLYGLLDQWWHTVYGFDVTLVSPPHVGLVFSIMVSMAGCLIVLARYVRAASGRPSSLLASIGCALAAAVLVMFITPTLADLLPWALFGSISWPNLVVSALFPATLLLVVSIVRRPWAGALFGLVFTLLDLALTLLVPAITRDYAASIGLFLRDDARGIAIVPNLAPTYVLIAGIAVDLILYGGRRFGWSVPYSVALAGAAAALALRVLEPDLPLYQGSPWEPAEFQELRREISSSVAVASLVLAPLVGAAAAWFGWLLGIVMHRGAEDLDTSAGTNHAPVVASAALAALLALTPALAIAHSSDPHHETMEVGPYRVVVGFSEWPILAERSIDITFEPESGITGKVATIRLSDESGEPFVLGPLGRHPRERTLWGLDLIALPASGAWTIEMTIDGPLGIATGTLNDIEVGERPGPPPAPFWLLASLPFLFLVWLGLRGWRTVQPGRTIDAHSWV